VKAMQTFRAAAPTATIVDHTARQMRLGPPPAPAAAAAAKVARSTGRAVGKTAARIVDGLAEVVERVLPD